MMKLMSFGGGELACMMTRASMFPRTVSFLRNFSVDIMARRLSAAYQEILIGSDSEERSRGPYGLRRPPSTKDIQCHRGEPPSLINHINHSSLCRHEKSSNLKRIFILSLQSPLKKQVRTSTPLPKT